jgi:antitoxin MazE
MRAKIIAIGTSRGIRIPKYLLVKYHLENLVEVDDTGEGIMIRPIKKPREGWDEAFKKAAGSEQDELIEMPDSEWDNQEWQW